MGGGGCGYGNISAKTANKFELLSGSPGQVLEKSHKYYFKTRQKGLYNALFPAQLFTCAEAYVYFALNK